MNGSLPPNIFVELPTRKRRKPFRLEEPMHPLQIAHFRRMTPGEKLEQMAAMRDLGVEIQKSGLRMRNPSWSEEQLETEARRRLMYART